MNYDDDDDPAAPAATLNDLDAQRFANALARPEAPTTALRELFLIERLTGTHEFSDRFWANPYVCALRAVPVNRTAGHCPHGQCCLCGAVRGTPEHAKACPRGRS